MKHGLMFFIYLGAGFFNLSSGPGLCITSSCGSQIVDDDTLFALRTENTGSCFFIKSTTSGGEICVIYRIK